MANELQKFVVRYLLIGVIGSAVIVLGARFLKVSKERAVSKPVASPHAPPRLRQAAVRRPRPRAETLARPELRRDESRPPAPDEPLAEPERRDEELREASESAQNVKWGVVKSAGASAFNKSGRFMHKIDPGTLVEISETKKLGKEKLVVCTVHYNGRKIPDVLMRTRDFNIRPGSLSQVSEEEKNLRAREVQLFLKIKERKNRLAAAQVRHNPYTKKYTAAKVAHKKYWEKARELQAKRDSARGADHVRYEDQLRKMKGEDIRLAQDIEEAKKKFDAWKARHARIPDSDPKIAALEAELEDVQSRLYTIEKQQ